MNKLRILKCRPSIGIKHLNLIGVKVGRFDVENETKLLQHRVLEVMRGLRSLRYTLMQVRYDWRGNNGAEGKTRLERVALSNVTDLGDVSFHQLQSISLDSSTPLF